MYSVVLMMALTTGGDSAALGHRGGHGCCGAEASCGGGGGGHHRGGHRHHGGGGCCGSAPVGCSSCGGYASGGSYGGGCANGSCGFVMNDAAPTAVIVVSLPADAKLTFDGEATVSTSEQRMFVAPVPEAGREYHYTLKAQVERDGKPLVVEQVITVRAGEETHVTLTPAASTVGVAQR